MSAETIAGIIIGCLGLIAAALSILLSITKNDKVKRFAEGALNIIAMLLPWMKKAETFSGKTGAEKKVYVLDEAQKYCDENNIPFDKDFIAAKIEELIEFSKNVNTKTA